MDYAIDERIRTIWRQLEDETGDIAFVPKRKYRRLEAGRETGIRLSCYLPDKSWELLIEIGSERETTDFSFPRWRGMAFDIVELDLPAPETYHISLKMQRPEDREVFLSLCSDLAEELQNLESGSDRKRSLLEFLARWARFFERHGLEGLSPERQRGLFGELCWLRHLLREGVNPPVAIQAWKGCDRGYHDFDLNGHVVEVKTTLSKEPEKVIISNERQLDNRGLMSLHLFVLSLIQAEMVGESLPDIVSSLRVVFAKVPLSSKGFESSLREAGYLDNQAYLYTSRYTAKSEHIFVVREGFPRIIELPPGLGDLRYALLLAACQEYLADVHLYINTLQDERSQ